MSVNSVTNDERTNWAALVRAGAPVAHVARKAGRSRHTVAKAVADVPRPERRERERRTLWVVPEWFDEVAKIAKRLGLVNVHSEAAGEGSPGKLLDEIGSGRIICTRVE